MLNKKLFATMSDHSFVCMAVTASCEGNAPPSTQARRDIAPARRLHDSFSLLPNILKSN